MPREDGERMAASLRKSISSPSISLSLYFRMLRLRLNMSSIMFAPVISSVLVYDKDNASDYVCHASP
jgi:hypothetical protein